MREPVPLSVVTLAVLADFAPAGLSVALGAPTFGVSLDNSIRVSYDLAAQADSTGTAAQGHPWVLLDVEVATIARGIAQLHARMFDENGRLLATAGQSAVARPMRQPS
jgi:acyl-CoA thioesterase